MARGVPTAQSVAAIFKTKKPRGFRPKQFDMSPMDALALLGQGNSKFEQQVDAIAKSMGIFFSSYQYWVPLTIMTETTIDFVLFGKKKIAIYADGPEHTLRPDVAGDDVVRRMELEAMGWVVVAIGYDAFMMDPEGQVAQILYA
jgi:hypothetical protein